jgi:periplasmic protein TonB
MLTKKTSPFLLSLVLHLTLFFALGAVLPNSAGDNRIFRVYLAGDAPGSAQDGSAQQAETVSESPPSRTVSGPPYPSLSQGKPPADEVEAKVIEPDHPAPAVIRPRPKKVVQPAAVPASPTPPVKSTVADKGFAAAQIPTSQSMPAPAVSATGTGRKVATEKKAGRTPATGSTNSRPASGSPGQSLGKDYLATVLARIEAAKRYPQVAIRRRMEGNVEVVFRLGDDGSLLAVSLAKSSGFRCLDEAATTAVTRAAPFAKIPHGIKDFPETLKITISFILTTGD